MSLSLIIISPLSLNKNSQTYFIFPFYLLTKTNVVTNLKPFNQVNNHIRLLSIAHSVSLTCSLG